MSHAMNAEACKTLERLGYEWKALDGRHWDWYGPAVKESLTTATDNPAETALVRRMMARLTDLLDEDHFAEMEGMVTEAGISPPPAEAKVADDVVRDAERYKLLRSFSWNAADLCVVTNPRFNVKLGSDCPSGARLDEKLDAMLAAKAKGGGVCQTLKKD